MLRQLVEINGDYGNATQNTIASQMICSSQGISPSMISSSSHVSVTSSPLDITTPPKRTDVDTLTPPGGTNDNTLIPQEGDNDDTLKDNAGMVQMDEHSDTKLYSQALSLQSDSILFQNLQHSVGGTNDSVQLTAEQRAQLISLCSHSNNEEDLQLDNTYHCLLDECDVTIVNSDDDVIECENNVMSQPWSDEHHLEQQQTKQ